MANKNQHTVKYGKTAARGAELLSKKAYAQAGQLELFNEKNQRIERMTVNKSHFDLQGAYPFLFDCIYYAITHESHRISKAKSVWELTFDSKDDFLTCCLGTDSDALLRQRLWRNACNLAAKPQSKVYMVKNKNGKEYMQLRQPFIINMGKEKPKKHVTNLPSIKEIVTQVSLIFDPLLFADILQGKGIAYFRYLGHLQTRIEQAYDGLAALNNPVPEFITPAMIRKGLLYIQYKHNDSGRVNFSSHDFLTCCWPDLLNNKGVLRSRVNYVGYILNILRVNVAMIGDILDSGGRVFEKAGKMFLPYHAYLQKNKDGQGGIDSSIDIVSGRDDLQKIIKDKGNLLTASPSLEKAITKEACARGLLQ